MALPRPDNTPVAATQQRPIRLGLDEHLSLFGMTGSGKTYRAKMLLRAVPRKIVLDSKHTYHDIGAKYVRKYEPSVPYQVFRASDDIERYDDYLRAAWRDNRPVVIYVDEVFDLSASSRNLTKALGRFIREGRERHQRVWMASQQPSNIPSIVFTESTHIFAFYINWSGHREKIEQFTGDGMADGIARLQGHDYYYFSTLERFPRFRAAAWDTQETIVAQSVALPRRPWWERLKERMRDHA